MPSAPPAAVPFNAAMVSHNESLGNHLSSIEGHGTEVSQAEHRLAEEERALKRAMGAVPRSLEVPHQHEQDEQTKLRVAHERIKRHHYSTMAKLAVLVEALGAEM